MISFLHELPFNISHHGSAVSDARIELTGYGSDYFNESGLAVFYGIAPQENLSFVVEFEELVYNGKVNVVDQNVSVEVDLALSSVPELFNDLHFSVFPNPASSKIKLIILSDPHDIRFLRIFDQSGMEVFSLENPERELSIDATTFASGVYVVVVDKNLGRKAVKLIVSR